MTSQGAASDVKDHQSLSQSDDYYPYSTTIIYHLIVPAPLYNSKPTTMLKQNLDPALFSKPSSTLLRFNLSNEAILKNLETLNTTNSPKFT